MPRLVFGYDRPLLGPLRLRLSRSVPHRPGWGPRRYLLTNRGTERVDGVTMSLLGAGVMPASAPSSLRPGETLEVSIFGRDLAHSTVLVVRWFRPTGEEYLWRVSF